MKNKGTDLLRKQADFFFRLGELTYAGLAVGAFVAWAFEKKIEMIQLMIALIVGMVVFFGFYYWGSKLYEKSLEE